MTPEQYREALQTLGLSQNAAARFLDMNERRARHIASGEEPVPRITATLLTLMVRVRYTPAMVRRLIGLEGD